MRLIKSKKDFYDLLEKLKFENERYWGAFTLMIFKLKKGNFDKFVHFLLDNLRISDSVFVYEDKVIVILEETTIRWAFILNNRLWEVIQENKLGFDYFCWVLQLDYITKTENVIPYLEKRLAIAEKRQLKECVDDISKYL